MKVIRIHHPLDKVVIPVGPVVLAMGFFDGVHRGHQRVIRTAKQLADQKGLPLAVLTYNHSPAIVYRRIDGGARYLTTLKQKVHLFAKLGATITYVVDFTSAYGAQTPQEFVDHYLMAFDPQIVVAGEDHTFGSGADATMANLPHLARERFQVVAVPTLTANSSKVGTSSIRSQILAGDIEAANEGLGYCYQTTGLVVHGFARGRQIGFPTLNIDTPTATVLPPEGVYATRVKIGQQWYDGMTNIGHNETFGDGAAKTLEINLFNFRSMVYGEEVVVEWYRRLRDTHKFAGVDELVAQMKVDRQQTVDYLRKHPHREPLAN